MVTCILINTLYLANLPKERVNLNAGLLLETRTVSMTEELGERPSSINGQNLAQK